MPRPARVTPKGCIYHVLSRGNNRQNIFKDEKDYQKYLEILFRYKEKYKFKLYHYVLMRNHIHLVLEPIEKGGSLAEIMKGINLSYAQHFKNRYRHIGHFWQDRYKSILISKDDYLLACGSYVELNPVRARIVEDPKEYRWSSYNAYAYGRADRITDGHSVYKELSENEYERRKRYRDYVKGMIRDKKAMKGEMNRRAVYGSEAFVKKMLKEHKAEAVIRPRGRLVKSESNNN